MALTDDQRAMLRLLAQGEEGYENIAALKGISVEQAKAEVKEALAAAAEESAPAAPREPPPQEPIPPEPPVEEPAPAPKPPAPESAPSPRSTPTKPAATSRRPSSRPPRGPMPPERRRLLAFTAGAVAVVAVVLIAIAVFGDSDSGSSEADSGSTIEAASAENGNLTQATLEPVDGGDASGQAIFGKVGKDEIVLQVTAEGLEPADDGESYTIWLYRTPKLSLRVGAVKVGESGRLGAQLPIPAELLAYVASGAFTQIYVSRTSDADYEAAVAKAKKEKGLPPYTGETVLRGEITGPVVKK